MGKSIKIRLVQLDKSNRDLLDELHKIGRGTLNDSMLSNIINGRYNYGMASDVLDDISRILDQWEAQK